MAAQLALVYAVAEQLFLRAKGWSAWRAIGIQQLFYQFGRRGK